ncbi:MAG: hypothetical protein ACYS26_13445 [Planctomycetota bacterium]
MDLMGACDRVASATKTAKRAAEDPSLARTELQIAKLEITRALALVSKLETALEKERVGMLRSLAAAGDDWWKEEQR